MEFKHLASSYSKYLIITVAVVLALFVFEVLSFPKYYESYNLIPQIESGVFIGPLKTFFLGSISVLVFGTFVFASFVSEYRYRIVFLVLFSLGALTEYGYQAAYSHFTVSQDMANAIFAADSRIMLDSAVHYFDPLGLVPCFAFAILLIFVKPVKNSGWRFLAGVSGIFFVFFSLTAYVSSDTFPSTSINAFYRTVLAFPINWYAGSLTQPALATFYNKPRETIHLTRPSAAANNIVFIVDESVRGDHLSLNGYKRKTTPFLDSLNEKGFVQNWGIAVSGTTCSITSNSLLLTGVTDLPDLAGNIYQYPSIFQYAKAAGYKTFYFDGQLSYQWNGKKTDLPDFGQWITPKELGKENLFEMDSEIARRVAEIVGNSTGNFIWINKFGVHAPYFPSYPRSETPWLPIPEQSAGFRLRRPRRNSEEEINNYDNAILYNSQSFFTQLIGDGPAPQTFYVYTSDHGQNLAEDGKELTHCSTTKNEANVPLFIVGDPNHLPKSDTNFLASHSNIFATLLDLMDLPGESRPHSYALSLFKATRADSKPRYYFEGNLNSRFGNSRNLFDQ